MPPSLLRRYSTFPQKLLLPSLSCHLVMGPTSTRPFPSLQAHPWPRFLPRPRQVRSVPGPALAPARRCVTQRTGGPSPASPRRGLAGMPSLLPWLKGLLSFPGACLPAGERRGVSSSEICLLCVVSFISQQPGQVLPRSIYPALRAPMRAGQVQAGSMSQAET